MELSHPHDALSTLLGARVEDRDGRRLGRVHDVVAGRDGDGAWSVTAVLVRGRWFGLRGGAELPWSSVIAYREAEELLVVTGAQAALGA